MIKQIITTLMAITIAGCVHFKTNEAKALEVENLKVCTTFVETNTGHWDDMGVTRNFISMDKTKELIKAILQPKKKSSFFYTKEVISKLISKPEYAFTYKPNDAPKEDARILIVFFEDENGECAYGRLKYFMNEVFGDII